MSDHAFWFMQGSMATCLLWWAYEQVRIKINEDRKREAALWDDLKNLDQDLDHKDADANEDEGTGANA